MARRTIFRATGSDPITKDTVIVKPDGTATDTFLRNWQRQRQNNSGLTTDAEALAAKTITTTSPITGGGQLGGVIAPIAHANSGVTPGTYTNPNITVDDKGHVTAVASGSGRCGMSTRLSTQAIAASTDTRVTMTAETYDDAAFIDIAGQPTRITIPAGVTRVMLSAQILWTNTTGNKFAQIWKNGAVTFYPGQPNVGDSTLTSGADRQILNTGILAVTPGDYFELNVFTSSAQNLTSAAFSIVAFA